MINLYDTLKFAKENNLFIFLDGTPITYITFYDESGEKCLEISNSMNDDEGLNIYQDRDYEVKVHDNYMDFSCDGYDHYLEFNHPLQPYSLNNINK
jgi:hypothetical protein